MGPDPGHREVGCALGLYLQEHPRQVLLEVKQVDPGCMAQGAVKQQGLSFGGVEQNLLLPAAAPQEGQWEVRCP